MKTEILQKIENILNATITEKEVIKNNGIIRHGLVISTEGNPISPTIYIDDIPEEDLIDFVINTYNEYKTPDFDIDIDNITTKDYILSHVYPQLVGYDKNKDKLTTVVYTHYLDMVVLYKVEVAETASFTVTKEMMRQLEISKAELHSATMANMEKTEDVFDMNEIFPFPSDITMLILTNEKRINGAAVILDNKFLDSISKRLGGDIYILPSSIHEVIAIPAYPNKAEGLIDMVKGINATVLSPDEILTDNVYFYSHGAIGIAER